MSTRLFSLIIGECLLAMLTMSTLAVQLGGVYMLSKLLGQDSSATALLVSAGFALGFSVVWGELLYTSLSRVGKLIRQVRGPVPGKSNVVSLQMATRNKPQPTARPAVGQTSVVGNHRRVA